MVTLVWGLCGYVWVNMLTLSPLKGECIGAHRKGCTVLVNMSSQCFFANKNLIITSTALKLCDVMDDVMTLYFMRCVMGYVMRDHVNTH